MLLSSSKSHTNVHTIVTRVNILIIHPNTSFHISISMAPAKANGKSSVKGQGVRRRKVLFRLYSEETRRRRLSVC
jgi:hypothetical protein